MYILRVRENADAPWQEIDALVGPAGYTPVKGKDYYTAEETEALKEEIKQEINIGEYATTEYVDNAIDNIPETDLSNYYTKEQVDQAVSNVEVDLTDYAKTADIDKKLEDYALKSDIPDVSGYATEEYVENAVKDVDLTGYATETYVDTAIGNIPATDLTNYYTKSEVDDKLEDLATGDIDLSDYAKTADLATVATTGNYNDLTNLPTIPSTTGLATTEYVDNAVKNVEVDLTDYYTKSEVDALIPDTTGFALKTEIPDVSGYALKTDIPDTSNFTTMSAVEAKGYQTAEQVETLINNAISAITDGEEVSY